MEWVRTGHIPGTTRAFEETLEGGARLAARFPLPMRLQRAKEVQQVLLLRRTQTVKPLDYLLRLRLHTTTQQTAEHAAVRGVCVNRVHQVGSAPVVKEKEALSQPPKWCRPELVPAG